MDPRWKTLIFPPLEKGEEGGFYDVSKSYILTKDRETGPGAFSGNFGKLNKEGAAFPQAFTFYPDFSPMGLYGHFAEGKP